MARSLIITSGNAKGAVKLEIFDEQDHLVRRYSSTDKAEPLEKIAGEHPNSDVLGASDANCFRGRRMHRFVWDMHYPPPDSLGREFPISAISMTRQISAGAWALPAKYTVKLTVEGKGYSKPW